MDSTHTTTFNKDAINNCVKTGVFYPVLKDVNFYVIDQIGRIALITGDAPYEHLEKVVCSRDDGTLYWLALEGSSASDVFNYIKNRYATQDKNAEIFLVRKTSVTATGLFVGNYELNLVEGTLRDVNALTESVPKISHNRLSGVFIPDLVVKA